MLFRHTIILMAFFYILVYPQKSNTNDVYIYNVEWTSPVDNVNGSMPAGNGDIGINVWSENNGDVLFLISKTDAFDENSTLLKLARIRIRFIPNPFSSNRKFRQILKLNEGEIVIKEGNQIKITIWVDANHPVINISSQGKQKYQQEVMLETWRDSLTVMKSTEVSDLFKNLNGPDPFPTIIYPDKYEKQDRGILWYHKNEKPKNDGYEINLKLQGLGYMLPKMLHPLHKRIFGALLKGDGLIPANQKKLIAVEKRKQFSFSVYVLTMHPVEVEEWKENINSIAESYEKLSRKEARKQHNKWWINFWGRSKMHITGTGKESDSAAYLVSRAYNLCRYMNACAGRGTVPIKFNGSIFSYGVINNPDYRRWGGPGFWFQNQRHIYYPMFMQGDFDLMQPWFKMYRNILPLQKERTKLFFNHDGAFFPETINFWGAEISSHYGWTQLKDRKRPHAESTYLAFYWQNGIEQTLMMYDYFEYTQDTIFARTVLIPHAEEVMKFYKKHYQVDNLNRIHFGPAQSLETYHVALNPLPEIAGLKYTLGKLLTLPGSMISKYSRDTWEFLLNHLPPVPFRVLEADTFLIPAECWTMKMNVENPELYAVFPYRLYGVGKNEINIGRNTFFRRLHKDEYCWNQNAVQAALLGLTDTVKKFVISRSGSANYSDSRFPAMWNAFNDWIPDVDHGGNLQMAVNLMIMQCEGKEIHLFPAWPKDWNLEFKLHAPGNTIINGKLINGRLKFLNVEPESRKKDIINHL